MNENAIIAKVRKQDRKAQTMLYDMYNRYWYVICLRYNNNLEDAQDVMQKGLIQIFSKINQFDEKKGTFKAWSSKVIVNENLMFLRKKVSSFDLEYSEQIPEISDSKESALDALSAQELTSMIQRLPAGYRAVFNMYVIEGYNHVEISDILNITTGTSKSQLFKAKRMLRKQLERQIEQESYV